MKCYLFALLSITFMLSACSQEAEPYEELNTSIELHPKGEIKTH